MVKSFVKDQKTRALNQKLENDVCTCMIDLTSNVAALFFYREGTHNSTLSLILSLREGNKQFNNAINALVTYLMDMINQLSSIHKKCINLKVSNLFYFPLIEIEIET